MLSVLIFIFLYCLNCNALWLFLVVLWTFLQCVIVVLSHNTHIIIKKTHDVLIVSLFNWLLVYVFNI